MESHIGNATSGRSRVRLRLLATVTFLLLGTSQLNAQYDWGRVRSNFSTGAIISEQNEQFSKVDLYLGFNMDVNWFKSASTSSSTGGKLFNTFVNARLTAIPVTGNREKDGEEDKLEVLLNSRKAVLLQAGFYVPYYHKSMAWQVKDAADKDVNYAVFVAPGGRIGFQTATGEIGTADAKKIHENSFFGFYGIGLRFGHYKLSSDANIAPELISYLDWTVGKWDNFEVFKEDGINTRKPLRHLFEGRLKVPGTRIVQVGFDANVGDGIDDLRFLFGIDFDIGKLVDKLL